MKTLLISLLISSSAVVAAASSNQYTNEPLLQAAPPAPNLTRPAPSSVPIADMLADLNDQVKAATFENRITISNAYDPVDRHIGDTVNVWKAQGSQFTDYAERQLGDARLNAVQAFKALADATEETWTTAKDNATSALQRLQSSLNDLKDSEKPKP
ncbi:MAG TPA: hypothetical protein VFJ90_09330 [Candidatus Didemnitutus sp.]|nr:hypothetical protein [Candidatus Didemnitutus sp.]